MAFYDEMADDALSMFDEFGQTLTMTRVTAGELDPVEGRKYDKTTQTQDIKGVRVPSNQTVIDQLEVKFSSDALTVANVVMLKVAAKGMTMTPEAGDTITIDGKAMPITAYTVINPAGIPLVYTIALKI